LQPEQLQNGEKVPSTFKELGSADLYAQGLKFNPSGQNFAVYGEKDYSIYTARGFKSIAYGQGVELVWSKGEIYAVSIDNTIKIIKGSQELTSFKLGFPYENIFGGEYL
jgi:hypothetical protein